MILGLTKRSERDLPKALEMFGIATERKWGQVWYLRAGKQSDGLQAYLSYEESGILVFYTTYRKTEEIPLIKRFLQRDTESHPLNIRPSSMQQALDSLLETDPQVKIVDFTARRDLRSGARGKVRPGVERTVSYWGADGREVLEELQYTYGVLPTRMVFQIPGKAKFGMDQRGIITHQGGDLSLPLVYLGHAVTEAKQTLLAFDRSAFEVFSVKQGAGFSLPISVPSVIRFKRKMEYSQVEDFEEALTRKGYTILSSVAQEGSLYLSTDVISREGVRFRIKADEATMKLLPTDKRDFRGFLDLYDVVLGHIDPNAELVA